MQASAQEQEKVGDLYLLTGNVVITYGLVRITADRVEYHDGTGELLATGDILYTETSQNESLRASRVEYNLHSGSGVFYEVEGSIGGLVREDPSLLTTTNPLYFTAEKAERASDNEFRVYEAEVTVCRPDDPTWTFSSRSATIRPGDSAVIRNATLRVLDVPVLFLPVFYRSLEQRPRTSGFLAPTVGRNSRLGFIFGESFYWAINRSMDAELGGEYLSKRGWSQKATFRTRPTENSKLLLSYYGVVDRGFGPGKVDQGGQTARAEGMAQLPGGFRGVVDFNYLSSLTFRESFSQTYAEAVDSEIQSFGYLTKNFDSYHFNVLLSRTENFQSLQENDTVRLRALPMLELNSLERPLWPNSPLWISWNSSASLVGRSEPSVGEARALRTSTMEKFDFHPRLSLPLRWKGTQLTPELGFRTTRYGNRRSGDRVSLEPWTRNTPTLRVLWDLPSLSRSYSGGGWLQSTAVRHVMEPKIEFRYANGVDDFANTLLFDEQDLVTNTKEFEYSLTNRLLARGSGGQTVEELLSWEVKQQYYFDTEFGGAIVSDRRNVFLSTLSLSGFSFLDRPRRFSPVASILRFRPSERFDVEIREDYDLLRHSFTHGGLIGNARWGRSFLSVSHSFVRAPDLLAASANQMGFSMGYGNLLRRGWNGVFAGSYDVRAGFLQFSAFQGSYNNDCCGISVEFRRFALGPARNENQFRVAFSLSNIGTFGNMKSQERLF